MSRMRTKIACGHLRAHGSHRRMWPTGPTGPWANGVLRVHGAHMPRKYAEISDHRHVMNVSVICNPILGSSGIRDGSRTAENKQVHMEQIQPNRNESPYQQLHHLSFARTRLLSDYTIYFVLMPWQIKYKLVEK